MSEVLEYALRQSMRNAADSVPSESIVSVQTGAYRPRMHSPVRRAAAGATPIVAVIVGLVLALHHAPSALAAWSPVPTVPAARETNNALQRCGISQPILVDTRGPYTAALAVKDSEVLLCLQGGSLAYDSSTRLKRTIAVSPSSLQYQVSGSETAHAAITIVDGTVGTGVRSVAFRLRPSLVVKATLLHGHFLAWWPNYSGVVTALLATRSETREVGINVGSVPGAHSCLAGGACSEVAYASSSNGG